VGAYFTWPKDVPILFNKELTAVTTGFAVSLICTLYFAKEKRIRNLYEEAIRRFNRPITEKVRAQLTSYSKIGEPEVRNLMIKSYIENVFEKRPDVWTKVIMAMNLIIISVNLFVIFYVSMNSNISSIYSSLYSERIKDIGVANACQELGIPYNDLPKSYIQFLSTSTSSLSSVFPAMLGASFLVIFYGFLFYLANENARTARNRAIHEIIIELFPKNPPEKTDKEIFSRPKYSRRHHKR
jgi:hypothetical protein